MLNNRELEPRQVLEIIVYSDPKILKYMLKQWSPAVEVHWLSGRFLVAQKYSVVSLRLNESHYFINRSPVDPEGQ